MNELPPIGARVRRNRPYPGNKDRVLTGTVVRHYDKGGLISTHAVVDFDDGMTGHVHPSALNLVSPPRPVPHFRSVEEADAWLETPPCLHGNVFTVFDSTHGACEDCGAPITIDPRMYQLDR